MPVPPSSSSMWSQVRVTVIWWAWAISWASTSPCWGVKSVKPSSHRSLPAAQGQSFSFSAVRVSRSLRDTAYKAMQVKERLTTQNNKEPSIEEIAKELELPKEDVVLALEAIVEPVSLYEPVFSDGNDTIFVMDQVGDKNDDNNWLDEIALKEAIRNLGPREKKILNLRFFQGKTQMEVAKEIGISQAQVSRLEKGSLERIKNHI